MDERAVSIDGEKIEHIVCCEHGGGNSEEDWKIFEILCGQVSKMEDTDVHDMTTALKSEIAALQYKKDKLTSEINEMRGQLRSRDTRVMELQVEADNLREQSARQSAIIDSLKKRLKDQEERERELYATQGRNDMTLQTLQRDCRFHEDRSKDLEMKLRNLEIECSSQEQKKEAARNALTDLVRRLSVTLGVDCCEGVHLSPESLVIKAAEIVQETNRLKTRANNLADNLSSVDLEVRTVKDSLERAISDKESLQRQSASQLIELERLRHEKEDLEMHQRVAEREIHDLREKLSDSTRSLGTASGNIAQQESTICNIRDELKIREEKLNRVTNEFRHLLESLAIQLSAPNRFVESHETSIKERIREILMENKDKSDHLESLREKLSHDTQTMSRQNVLQEQASTRIRMLEDEKNHLESRVHKLESELNSSEINRDGLKRDKTTFMAFLERLARALNMDELSQELGVDLHTESLLVRAEQLARLESDKLVDKTSTVYQLQRRCRTLREQIQRKDLHLDLLRRKLALQEDNTKVKVALQNERDEANLRIKKLLKQVERLQIQLSDSKAQCRELNAQLAEAADYKITALERGRKVEELQKRLVESEMLRTRYTGKVNLLKDKLRTTGDTIEQERTISEHSMQVIRDDLVRVKEDLTEVQRRESQLQSFKASIAKILGAPLPMPDYELISRLQKLVDAHHDYTLVSRRYDDPVLRLTSRSPTAVSRMSRTPDRSRYDDSGYADAPDIDDIDDELFPKRPIRPSI